MPEGAVEHGLRQHGDGTVNYEPPADTAAPSQSGVPLFHLPPVGVRKDILWRQNNGGMWHNLHCLILIYTLLAKLILDNKHARNPCLATTSGLRSDIEPVRLPLIIC